MIGDPAILLFNAEAHYNNEERELEKLDAAWAKAALFFRTGEHFGHSPLSSRRIQGLSRINDQLVVYQRRFEQGETLALLHAVAMCAEENLPLPTWLATAYLVALESFLKVGGAVSLDEVFNSSNLPTNTPKKAAAARQDWELGKTLWVQAWEVAQSNESLKSLSAVVDTVLAQRDYGVSKTKAQELIKMIEKSQGDFLQSRDSKDISRFLSKRRKR